jgi:hypothetical protein
MEPRGAVTIRFPSRLLATARELKAKQESLNDLVVEAVAREVPRRQGLWAVSEIANLRKVIERQTGLQQDSTTMIRGLREGAGRRE